MQTKYFYSFLNSRINKIKRKREFEIIATGLSYALYGIVEKEMKKKCVKLTLPSQDLYYDYAILRSIIPTAKGKIKYCILGISYYSFDLDLRYTEPFRIWETYYPILKDSHSLDVPQDYSFDYKGNIIDRLVSLWREAILDTTPDFKEGSWNKGGFFIDGSIESMSEESRIKNAKERVSSHNKLNYPITRKENEGIFSKSLELLISNGIKPIIVVFPATKYYSDNFNTDTIDKFYYIINELKKIYDFQLIDMFKSEEFNLSDFLDWDHLNKQGATKMTKCLNDLVEW